MAEFRNMMDSDDEDMDHIPKTPGPVAVSDKESEEEESNDERNDKEVKEDNEDKSDNESDKNNVNESDSDSDSSSSSESSNENKRSKNDSEVERSDNENEDNDKEVAKEDVSKDANEEASSDDNDDNVDKTAAESQDNDSDGEEEIQRMVSPKKKRQLEDNSDSSDAESGSEPKRARKDSLDNEDNDENEDKDDETNDKSAKAQDIFGEMSSEDEEDKDERKDNEDKDSDKQSVNDNNERRDEESGDEDNANRAEAMGEQPFAEDEEQPEEPIPETRIEVEIPRIVADLGREVHFVKLPNFLSIDTHPYDPQWYEDEIDEDENLDDEGRARLKLKVENTIRWRNVVDKEVNELKKESNARVVRWSDGSFSLHLGEEIFDIHKLQLMTGDNNHLFIRQGTGLQGQTVFRTKLNFRPFSTESFTHRKLTLSLADRSQKTQKIRVLPNVGKDPEAHRTEMIKKEEDRLKASIRRENKQRRVRERSLVRGPTASYLEPDGDEDDEEEGISIARIKNQFKRGSFNKSYDDPEYSGEDSKQANDDDSDDDLFDKKEKKRRAAHIDESDDD